VTDYHTRPVLSARIDGDLKAWALAEAKRPGLTLGAVLDEALADLRAKREQVDHVVDQPPPRARARKPREDTAPAVSFVAASPEQPQQDGKPCTHPKDARLKGRCTRCKTFVGFGG
jgi:hypothetical protein